MTVPLAAPHRPRTRRQRRRVAARASRREARRRGADTRSRNRPRRLRRIDRRDAAGRSRRRHLSFTVEGLLDDDYKQVRAAKAARLFLYWRDTDAANADGLSTAGEIPGVRSALLSDFLVAELSILSVTRRVGSRFYDTVITPASASTRSSRRRASPRRPTRRRTIPRPTTSRCGSSSTRSASVAESLALHALGARRFDRYFGAGATGTELLEFRGTPRGALRSLRPRHAARARWRAARRHAPHPARRRRADRAHDRRRAHRDDGARAGEHRPEPRPRRDRRLAPTRRQFRLVLKGRPDIKPGSVVAFDPPPATTTRSPCSRRVPTR